MQIDTVKSVSRSVPLSLEHWYANVLTALFFLIWWLLGYVLPHYLLPNPLSVARTVGQLLTDANVIINFCLTMWHVVSSIAIATIVGIALALLSYFAPVTERAIHHRLNPFLSSFSMIGWTFLAIIWFGLNELTVIFAVSITLLPFSLSNMSAALNEIDSEMTEMASSFSREKRSATFLIILPLAVPYLFATLRICLGVAWKVVLTAELFGGTSGFGYIINRARADFDTERIFAIIAIIVIFVYVLDKFVIDSVHRYLRKNYSAV